MSLGLTRQGMANLAIISVSTVFRQRQCLGVRPLEDASLSNDQRTIIIRQTLQNTQNAGKDMFLVV